MRRKTDKTEELRVHAPWLEVEFYTEPRPRALHVVHCVDGVAGICDDAAQAVEALDKEVAKYLKYMTTLQEAE